MLEVLSAGTLVVDTRSADAFAGGHIPGTINIPLGASFVTWAGWLVPYDRPFTLIVDEHDAQAMMRELRSIGLDTPAGYATSGVLAAWSAQGHELATSQHVDPAELHELLAYDNVQVLDVREPSETALGAIEGSHAIPLGYLTGRLDEIPKDRTVEVYCQSGMRSSIAASVLSVHGYPRVVNLDGGFEAWHRHQMATSAVAPAQAR